MMQQTQSVVIPIDAHRRSSELRELLATIESANWTLRVQAVLQAAGHALGESAAERETPVSIGSLASAVGFETMGEFVSNTESGLGLDWESWATDVQALKAKYAFGLHGESAAEIIREVTRVTDALGRKPGSASEFHLVRDRLRERESAERTAALRAELERTAEHNGELVESLHARSAEAREYESRAIALEAELEAQLAELERRMEEARAARANAISEALADQKQELLTHFEAELERERLEAHARAEGIRAEMRVLHEAERGKGGVDLAEHKRLRAEVARMRKSAEQLARVRKQLEKARADIKALRASEKALKSEVRTLKRANERVGKSILRVREEANGRIRRQNAVILEQRSTIQRLATERNIALVTACVTVLMLTVGAIVVKGVL
ncbi:putative RNase H-like nuclease (RuvC/YqgF family) [Natronocella acetinitrilica]|uniref:RNase H-like nuclease (RuvC/YqgF family) n=1 Tax=Natronocella acetinitrilica TaxID=414046 RepID=A0AAE3G354_9GAMM|nr:hypothetical protein [Natronocella acetinitrilica]MCP1674189.1 putative RNase H-like nuclease (RuvC/YqgF family) [Natronocella acetinitrilica]